jgi:hypothetical protein
MHSIGVWYRRPKRCARLCSVHLPSAVEESAVLKMSGGVGEHERALRDRFFPVASQASKTPCANRDPYPRPDSSCGTSVWSRTTRPSSTLWEGGVAPVAPRVGVATQTEQSAVAAAARAVTARPARPNPCVVIGPSRIRLCDRGSGSPAEACRHAFSRIHRVSAVSKTLSRIFHVAAEFI